MSRLLLLLLVFLFRQDSATVSGSTLIVYRSPKQVVLGADSRANYEGNPLPFSVCKIYIEGDLAFGIAGRWKISPGFDAVKTTKAAVSRATSWPEALKAVETDVTAALLKTMTYVRLYAPIEFSKEYLDKDAVNLFFISNYNNTPTYAVRSFSVGLAPLLNSDVVQIDIRRQDCPGNCETGSAFFTAGKIENIKALILRTGADTYFRDEIIVESINTLIAIESDAEPKEVGGPIYILKCDETGFRWLQNDQQCRSVD